MERFHFVFSDIEDPREGWKVQHELLDVLGIALCAFLSGAQTFTEMAQFGREREKWFRKFLKLKNGIPSHDTIRRVFFILDPVAVEARLIAWAKHLSPEALNHLCFDGKSIKGTQRHFGGKGPVHVLNVFAHEQGITLGQITASGPGGEVEAMLEAVDLIGVKNTLVSIDAAGAVSRVATKILEGKGDYIVPIKKNQRAIFSEVEHYFRFHEQKFLADPKFIFRTEEKAHGREESRQCVAVDGERLSSEWALPGIKTVIKISRTRKVKDKRFSVHYTNAVGNHVYEKNKNTLTTTEETIYYVSSRKLDPESAATRVRDHWAIENNLHWSLDVSMGEDEWVMRMRRAAANLAAIRKVAYNILKLNKEPGSLKGKIKRAGWNPEFLNKLLFGPHFTPESHA